MASVAVVARTRLNGLEYLVETKAANQMEDPEVLAKAQSATTWCRHASAYAAEHGGKPWLYVLVPHDAALPNATISKLVETYGVILQA